MAFLIVSGITVKVSPANSTKSEDEVGDFARAFDGTARSTVRARKRNWHVATIPVARATADTLETALKSATLPLVCSGDLLGATVNCLAHLDGWTAIHISGSHYVVVAFTLMEV